MNIPQTQKFPSKATPKRKRVGGNEYVVKSVFLGNKDIKSIILGLAERKVIREMGLDIPINKNGIS